MKKTTIACSILVMSIIAGCGKTVEEAPVEAAEVSTEQTAEEASAESGEAESSDENEAEDSEATENSEAKDSESADGEESSDADKYADAILKDLSADYFTFGVGINGSTPDNQCLNNPAYMELSKKQFNSCTMTNLMKSCYILDQFNSQENLLNGSEEPALSFFTIDPTLKWCQENGMKMRGHTLVWHTQAPEWFFREDYKDDGEYVSREVMLVRMESYIKQLLTHVQTEYPGVIYCWDVVNEAVDPDSADPESYFKCRTKIENAPNPWYETIGQDYVEMAFTYARKYADSDVKLFYNDYNTFQAPKTEGIYNLAQSLKEKGLIDGIGMQGYWGIDYPPMKDIRTAIEKFAELGLEIQITELSVGVDKETDAMFEKQADKYEEIFNLLCDMDTQGGGPANITNVTVFGLVDHYREGDTTNSRLFDRSYMPKPAFGKIVEVLENKCASR